MIFYIYNIGVDLYNGFNGLRHRINWTYFTVLNGLAHPLYSRDEIMDIFDDLKQQGKCIIIVTHSKEVAKRADKIYTL